MHNTLENIDPDSDKFVGELISGAWGLIANAGEGDWTRESPEWQEAAKVWRENWHKYLDRHILRSSRAKSKESPLYIEVER